MPSPKSGTTCDLVAPAPPKTALPADEADPGAVEKAKAEQSQTGTGKYGSIAVSKSSDGSGEESSDAQTPTAWISFSLKDDAGKPVADEPYLIKLADGTEQAGSLDDQGKMKLTGITPGTCQISFPRIDKGEWRKL